MRVTVFFLDVANMQTILAMFWTEMLKIHMKNLIYIFFMEKTLGEKITIYQYYS